MLDAEYTWINEEFHEELVTPQQLDRLLNDGWRHFGTYFFRYSLALYRLEIRRVVPLRIRLADFLFSKSQRRILQKNKDLTVTISPADLSPEKTTLFDRHKQRFEEAVPISIYDFLSADSDKDSLQGLRAFCVASMANCSLQAFSMSAKALSQASTRCSSQALRAGAWGSSRFLKRSSLRKRMASLIFTSVIRTKANLFTITKNVFVPPRNTIGQEYGGRWIFENKHCGPEHSLNCIPARVSIIR